MGYRILYGTDILWEPYSDNTDAIIDANMSVNVNAAKYLDFTMPPTHSLYNVIAERDKLIRLYANDKLIYKGYITKITLDMEGYKQVNCSSVMSYLGDTHVRDYSTIEGEQPLKAPTSLDGLFQWYIDQHNKHCMDSNKRFIVGVNQAGALDENNYVYRSSTQFPTTSSEIEEKILNLGGYIFERYEDDNNILDFYADAHEANTQILDFGVNITDFTHERSGEDQYTAIYATGYTPDPPENDPEKKMRPISLADIQNGGSPYSPDLFKLGDVLYSISGVQRYGYREYYYSNDDITTTDYLLKAAGVVLTKLLAPTITLDVKAVDMALFMENGYEHLQLGQAVRVRSKPHNIDEYLMISGIDLDLQDPGQTTYTIGATYDTLTGQQSSYLKSLNSGINSSLDSVAALDKATKENAKGIDEAKKDAANATSKANEASNKADLATNTANSANTKANEANTKAETATNTANSANTKANEANSKADIATETANIANTKANEANTKAETATNTANSANTKANEANSKAETATSTANRANTKANEANTKADTATETANSANAKADEANTKAETATNTANSANAKADEANTKADTATETANSANTKADEAKADASNANSKADTAIETANSASQNAQKAQEGVAAAKDAASKAQAAADKAQSDANANTKAAAQAQSAADAAKKAAADAQEKAENVESNLESANAVIEQHSNKLGELSTKVSNAVTNADAALTASTEAKQTATEASTTANTAYRDSQTAITNSTKATQTATEAKTTAESAVTTANDSLKQSSSAVQTANRIQNTLTTDYQTKADSDLLYATKSSLTETSESIKMEVSANYATKSTVEALQNVADNAIESWRGSGIPTSENKPASDWTTTEEKKRHSGDLYYDKDTGKAYRWGSDDGVVYSWVLNQDTDITKALQDASNAQKSADNAQTTANGAVTAAGNAQKSADGAQSTADRAKTAATNAQKTADSVQTDVDQLKIDIPNTYATKASLETTASSITAQVESVSTTANSAVTAASKVQQTADAINVNLTKNYQTKENADNIYATKATLTATSESLSTSIKKAQQTADGAVNAASTAQQTADAININLTKNYQTTKDADDKYATQTSLNATAESITSTVSKTYATKTEVTSAIDGISVGGINLLTNTGDGFKPTGGWSQSGSTWVPEGYYEYWYYEIPKTDPYYETKVGDVVTISFDAEVYDPEGLNSGWLILYDSNIHASVSIGSDSITFPPNSIPKSTLVKVRGSSTRTLFSKQNTGDIRGIEFYSGYGSGKYFKISRLKIERGNKATDWTPAPEDLVAESKTYTDSQLKITSDSITSTVSKTYATKTDIAENYTTTVDMNSKIEQTANSIKSEVSEVYQPKGDYAIKSEVDQTIEGVETKITTVTNTANTLNTLIRQSGNGVEVAKKVNGAYTSTKTLMDSDGFYVKDDSGNNLTQIKPAQAIIGKAESKNVLVNSNGINIRNGENTIASFSENIVELGKNSKRSTIEMCGGSGSIYQENDTMWIKSLLLHGGIGLIGDNVWLRGNLFAGVFVGQDGLEVNHNENLTTISGNDGMSLIRVGRETINFSIHSNTIFNIQPNGVYINNCMVSDFVVAEGKCDFWTYRMWNSGIAECWGHTSETTVSVTSEWGYLYDSGTGHTNGFPGNTTASSALKFNVTIGGKKYTKLFTSVEHCDCNFISSDNVFIIEIGSGLTNLQTPQVFLLRPTSADVTGKFSYHAIGRWKA